MLDNVTMLAKRKEELILLLKQQLKKLTSSFYS